MVGGGGPSNFSDSLEAKFLFPFFGFDLGLDFGLGLGLGLVNKTDVMTIFKSKLEANH